MDHKLLHEMINVFNSLKKNLKGTWTGEGFSKYPTIIDTPYTEEWTFLPDEFKNCIHYNQKTWYKNTSEQNEQTVFWDTGFILLKDNEILLVSSQAGGRQETYLLIEHSQNTYRFKSQLFGNDPKMVKSERILRINGDQLSYELNMETIENGTFENHLKGDLIRKVQ